VDKEKVYEEENADFFVDDDIKITQKVGEHFWLKDKPFQAFLMTSNYNKGHLPEDHIEKVDDFDDFARCLKNFGIELERERKKLARLFAGFFLNRFKIKREL